MTNSQIPNKKLLRLLLLVVGAVMFLLFASHPELRLLLPFFEALGLDLFVVLVASQTWIYIKPPLIRLYKSLVQPALHTLYTLVVLFLNIAGPYFHAQASCRFPSLMLRPSNSFTLPLAGVIVGTLIGPLPGTALHVSPSWVGPTITGTAITILLLALLLWPAINGIVRSKGRNVAA